MKNGYAICLNEWLDDPRLKKAGMLELLLRISSLTAEKGYCYASNSHFAEKINQTEISISRKIKQLEKLGYIEIEYKKRGAEITSRKIRLGTGLKMLKNVNRRLTERLIDDKLTKQSTINSTVKGNNTSINNTSINKENKKEKTSHLNFFEYLNPDIYTEEEKKERINSIYNELKNSNVWIEDIARAAEISTSDAWIYITKFLDYIKAREDYFKPLSQIKKHCVNWIMSHKNIKI